MISKNQRIHLMADCWNPACKAQGWKASNREFRLQKFSELLGRPLKSSDDIEPIKEFGQLKAKLLRLADNVRGATEDGDTNHDERRRMLWTIEHFYKPCLGVYVADVETYLNTVLKERFKIVKGLSTYEDLSSRPRIFSGEEKPSQMQMFIFTLGQRLQKFRSEAHDTIHDMKMKANVPCDCSICTRPQVVLNHQVTKAPSEEVPVNNEGVMVPF